MKKYFFYYGTEENAYEINKDTYNDLDSAIAEVEETLKGSDEQFSKDGFKKQLELGGYALVETENAHGYNIVVGIATQGHCKEIRGLLQDYRREIIALF